MNRIEKVLTQIGFTINNLESIVDRCPGSYIDGLPRAGENSEDCTCVCVSCTECWESEVDG